MSTVLMCLGGVALLTVACGSPTGANSVGQIQGSPPLQVRVTGNPAISRDVTPGSLRLVVSVTATDSLLHRSWRPSVVRVATDRGYDQEILLVPFACLERNDSGRTFPLNFRWLFCNVIVLETPVALSAAQLNTIDSLLSGRLIVSRTFVTIPDAEYTYEVPVGMAATAEAVRRVRTLPFVRRADRLPNDPFCVVSDVIPPPACPPWSLKASMPFTYSGNPGDSIPVRSGGWVRATYTDALGVLRVSQYSVP